MNRMFSLYLTPHHASVTIQNGASRATSANTVNDMIAGMASGDVQTLETVCAQLLEVIRGNRKNMTVLSGQ